jgi:hypothetical protein
MDIAYAMGPPPQGGARGLLVELLGYLIWIVLLITITLLLIKFFRKFMILASPKWKLRIGVVQLIGALATYIWASNHSPYALNYSWSFREGYYILIIVGVICYAILGIGNIVIGVLNIATDKKKLQQNNNSVIQNIDYPMAFKFCSQCGAKASSQDTFCSECGHSLK